MPSKSPSQHRLMEAAAHTPGGYGGVPQKVGKEFVRKDADDEEQKTITALDIARAIRDGEIEGPYRMGNIWLFDLRITGTGVSYRTSIDEWVYRDPSYYLNDEFLTRCNGLPVLFDHPAKGVTNTDEWRNRAIGTIVLPYIPEKEDDKHRLSDVWGIARIYDSDAAELMMREGNSTSPAVQFMDGSPGRYVKTDDGEEMLIENEPELIDHLAVVYDGEGVWDKLEKASGVNC